MELPLANSVQGRPLLGGPEGPFWGPESPFWGSRKFILAVPRFCCFINNVLFLVAKILIHQSSAPLVVRRLNYGATNGKMDRIIRKIVHLNYTKIR